MSCIPLCQTTRTTTRLRCQDSCCPFVAAILDYCCPRLSQFVKYIRNIFYLCLVLGSGNLAACCMAAEIEFLLWLLSNFDKFPEPGQKWLQQFRWPEPESCSCTWLLENEGKKGEWVSKLHWQAVKPFHFIALRQI